VIAFGRGQTTEIADCDFIAAHRYWDGKAWTGNMAIKSYAGRLKLRNVRIIAVPGQDKADRWAVAAREDSFNAGCIDLSTKYTSHPEWIDLDPQIECENVHVWGWPLSSVPSVVTKNGRALNVPGITYHPSNCPSPTRTCWTPCGTGGRTRPRRWRSCGVGWTRPWRPRGRTDRLRASGTRQRHGSTRPVLKMPFDPEPVPLIEVPT
jgi:hypothetical protein